MASPGVDPIRARADLAPIAGGRVLLRPLEPEDEAPLRAIRATPEVAAWWAPPPDDFPFADEPDVIRLAIVIEGEVVGMIQFAEEPDPDSRHADIDIFLHPRHHGQGIGTEALSALAAHLLRDRGHHRLTLWTSPRNAAAIRCYEKVGFRRVGVTRASSRNPVTGEWEDELFMELVIDRCG